MELTNKLPKEIPETINEIKQNVEDSIERETEEFTENNEYQNTEATYFSKGDKVTLIQIYKDCATQYQKMFGKIYTVEKNYIKNLGSLSTEIIYLKEIGNEPFVGGHFRITE